VVEKAPDLSSFYDSRNIMPAMVGLDLVLLAILNALGIIFRNIRFLNTVGRDLLLAYILGASITSGFYTGLALWRDWFTQTTIMNFLRDNSESLRDVRTFVFDDRTSGMRVGSRIIWNYEYTGNLITVYNTRDRFGISTDEYNNWPPNVPLLTDPILRQRYNIGDYQFNKPHAIIFLQNGVLPLTPVRTLAAVKAYLSGQNWQSQPDEYLKVGMGYEFVEVDAHVAEIYKITDALLAYRRDHGYFPAQIPPVAGGMPIYQIEGNNHAGPTATIDDIPGLFPAYLPRPADMVPHRADEPHYMYLSDGLDFKLVYASPHDLAYAKQAHPALIDPARSGYGVWTLDAKNW